MMSDKEESAPVAAPVAGPVSPATEGDTIEPEAPTKESKAVAEEQELDGVAKPAEPAEAKKEEVTKAADVDPTEKPNEKPTEKPNERPTETAPAKAEKSADLEMADAPENEAPAEGSTFPATATPKTKAPASRRKSLGGSSKGKTLNKKASKAQILHIDAQPGNHYFIKLKGFSQWPCIICDEAMLPQALLKTRPVSAARADGGYREDFADGGKNAPNRTFPIMYLATNEFGWVSNKDLIDLDPATVMEQTGPKMRKDLVFAHELAEQQHDLDYYKDLLQQFQDELLQQQEAAEAKTAAAASSKSNKKKGKATTDEDVEMEDVDDEAGPKKDKKRKNTDSAETPQRAESVKKLKIKLTQNSTPKANGTSSKVGKSGGDGKVSKKAKKPKEVSEERVQTPAAPELSASEKFERKKKEVLFLRHKLQKGLLTRDQQPKEDEMKMMSDYLAKLEGFPDLETDIIKTTKINKVLKAMLKLENIPKEEQYEFKPRSQVLLDKWNTLLADEAVVAQSPSHAEPKSEPNGVMKVNVEEADAPKTEFKEGKNASKKEDSPSDENVTSKMEEASLSDEKPTKEEVAEEEKPKVAEASKASEVVDAAA